MEKLGKDFEDDGRSIFEGAVRICLERNWVKSWNNSIRIAGNKALISDSPLPLVQM